MDENIVELEKDRKVAVIREDGIEILSFNRITNQTQSVHLSNEQFEKIMEAMKGGE
ncbi:hypothetical protein ACFOLK_11625 [Marinococcus halophilus]|uniref:Uncharacterized protein n=1 Tax=Marinococcus halophilus TaxID=1371 RepID=A0A510Y2N6_MARHA|nr:hypothetical protein [Marinococcus halophilus]GEK57111.1 hypothetical protein MHA01_00160 [Marinococcus halophilus]